MKSPKLQAISALFVAFPSQERTDNERELGQVYLMAVEGIDDGFVALACKRFVQGQVPNASPTWRPTPAEVATEARRLKAAAKETERIGKLPWPRERLRIAGPKPKFMPYPKLWDALADSPDLLKVLEAMTFDGMTDISKTMAIDGLDAAKTKLQRLASTPSRQKASAA